MRFLAPLGLVAMAFLLVAPYASGSSVPPKNDHFDSAETLTGESEVVDGNTTGATFEPGEPDHRGFPARHSVWYRWVAPSDGTVFVHTNTSFTMGGYTGSVVDGLTSVVDDGGSWRNHTALRFSAVAGRTYHFAVDSGSDTYGGFRLTLSLVDPPPNDFFEMATPLAGDAGSVEADTRAATTEAGEPSVSGRDGATIWYEWTAFADAGVTLDTDGSEFDTTLGVYTGEGVDRLDRVAANDNVNRFTGASQVGFRAIAGTTYRIQLDGARPAAVGRSKLAFRARPPPLNDFLAAATPLPSEKEVTTAGRNDGATREPGEPTYLANYPSKRASVWYSWTAPADGALTMRSSAPFDTDVAAYTGNTVATLEPAEEQNVVWVYGQRRVRVEAGVTYRIAVDSHWDSRGDFELSLSLAEKPPNDDFADAQTLSGLHTSAESDIAGATWEACEPMHRPIDHRPSVWYEWTAPSSGAITLEDGGGGIFAYTGDELCNLTQVATTTPAGSPRKRRMRVTAGTTYRFAVLGSGTLSLDHSPPPPNDMFADAESLTGRNARTSGNNIGATGEDGERNPGGVNAASVWYRWTAPATGLAVVRLPSRDFEGAGLNVYTGDSVGSLTREEQSWSRHSEQVEVAFHARAGTTYHISVDGYVDPQQGNFTLSLDLAEPPPNDDFANPTEISGTSADGTTLAATREPDEPDHTWSSDGATVWYRWTAATSGRVTVRVGAGAAVYTGDALASLHKVAASHYGPPVFEAHAGTTYRLAVTASWALPEGDFRITLDQGSPRNDDFASAEELSGWKDSAEGTTLNSTTEPGEPDHRDSIWYRWTAPADGRAELDLRRGDVNTVAVVYAGSRVDSLREVTSAERWTAFPVTGGTAYSIALRAQSPYGGRSAALDLQMHTRPPNDNLAKATQLHGRAVSTAGSTHGATREVEARNFFRSGGSVWYRWTAPDSRVTEIHLSTAGDRGFDDTGFAVYAQGWSESLTTVIRDGTHWGKFAAVAGTEYLIVVDGAHANSGDRFALWVTQQGSGRAAHPGFVDDPVFTSDPPKQLEIEPARSDEPSQPSAPSPPVATAPLRLSFGVLKQRLKTVLSSGLASAAGCTADCTIDAIATLTPATAKKAKLRGKATMARTRLRLRADSVTPVSMRFTKRARTALRALRKVALTIRVSAKGGQDRDAETVNVTIRR